MRHLTRTALHDWVMVHIFRIDAAMTQAPKSPMRADAFWSSLHPGMGAGTAPDNSYQGGVMPRIFGLVLGLSFFMAGHAWALGGMDGAQVIGGKNQSLIVPAHGTTGKPSSEKQKCKALNRCRYKYTVCYDKLVRDNKNIEREKITCVKPYQKCINASFSGFDFFITRWFNPEADCNSF